MSKKNKQYINKNNIKSVSLITITQFSRFECLNILFELIKEQTYSNIIEWIIVEGSKDILDADLNKEKITNLISQKQTELNLKIIYIEKKQNAKLGELRNIGNSKCTGEIIVCMDDDDYYPPSRVEHAVKKLSESNFKIAGCSNHYMYDYNLNMLVQMKIYGKYHSPNSCMAWKKEYLKINSHDPDKDYGEESSFTNNFTEPMVQLEPDSTLILSSHNLNTFSKKKFFISVANGLECTVDKIIYAPIESFIPKKYYDKYNYLFDYSSSSNDYSIYDIVYMCGGFSISWDPSDKKLGGSEQAVVNLSENWVKNGKKVIVYGEVPDKTINGVEYKKWYKFNYKIKYKNLILWRIYGLMSVLPFGIKADFIGFDVHDNFVGQIKEYYIKYKNFANKIFLKSNYHKDFFIEHIDFNYDKNKLVIIPNGVRIEKFVNPPYPVERNPYRFCYCSYYSRGLDTIISKLWPIIYSYEPRAELHVYYGIESIENEEYRKYIQFLLSQPGVMDHGKQPVELISREKYMSTFHLYLTNTKAEIDCISIKESILAGCIPIISNFGVFKERDGIHLDFDNDKQIQMAGIIIINLLKNPDKLEIYKNQLTESKSKIFGWDKIAFEWINSIQHI